ncbi:hypothetical protein [Pseudobacteriovorax antillogorgiicola]|uniref:Uncharacterized protein n=1 Tax=Pseudobacteriovorax antillogorgiicola TaxID=1513793 RepID=A0A1Y6BSJ2_9BACT|nr:hypothetical protein [Pseudobacteriovorax antillogorgiicola]TCS54599.1 hypothetical protein EDD56_106112 [Pseudobacteriovorax antillogorgiicola]SMF17657.1 hypothetical protein SAMN06296036_106131 [Pseudobacteriovorax antillogorgiicola]
MRNLLVAFSLIGLTSSAMSATQRDAQRMKVTSDNVRSSIERIEGECQNVENETDVYIVETLLPAINERLEDASFYFDEAAFELDKDPKSFTGRRQFQRGCSKTSQATLRVGTARIKSLDGKILTPYAEEFDELKDELEFARETAGC